MRNLAIMILVILLGGCTSMSTIQKMVPMETWESESDYSTFSYCVIDDFESKDSMWSRMTALDYRVRPSKKYSTIQGSAKADRNFGIFEITVSENIQKGSTVELRAIKDPSTTAVKESIINCIQ